MPSVADVVDQVQQAGLPVVFLDTCILLDVIRAPLRPVQLAGCIEAAQQLVQLLIILPFRCVAVVRSLVPREWFTHSGYGTEGLRTHIAEINDQAGRLHRFCGLMGITPPFPTPADQPLALADR